MSAPFTAVFEGTLYDGGSAAGAPVRVRVEGAELVIAGASGERRERVADITADAPLPGVPRVLRLADGATIATAAQKEVERIAPCRSRIERLAFALESRWSTALAAVLATAIAAVFVVRVVLPPLAGPIAAQISPEVERAVGAQALRALDRSVFAPSGIPPEERAALKARFDAYFDERDDEEPTLEFRGGKVGANALALPGGTIVVTDDLVRLLTEGELMAVIAHEMGHVRHRHALRLLLQDSGLAVLVTALAGDAVSMTVLAAALPAMLVQAHYSRAFEREADDEAIAGLERHGESPQVFADALRRLQGAAPADDDAGVLSYLSTHPGTEERIRRAEAVPSR